MLKSKENTVSLSGLACKIFGHKYRVLRKYRTNYKEFECAHCKSQFTQNDEGYLTPLTPKLRRINEVMEKFYLRKMHRQSA